MEVYTNDEQLFRLTADNLLRYGFLPVYGGRTRSTPAKTEVVYFSSTRKASFDWLLAWIVDVPVSQIRLLEEEGTASHYQVTLGADYDPCRPELEAPTLDDG